MFRSRLGALVFLGSILFAVYRMVGTEDQAGELALAGERIAAQRELVGSQQADPSRRQSWQEDDLAADGWGDAAIAPDR